MKKVPDAAPAYDLTDPRFWDEKDLRSEVERVFHLCSECRLCVKFCGSFPKLFDAIDSYCTEEEFAEVDSRKLEPDDVDQVVDLCFQCKLCNINCPYTPGDHDWAIDFPRLMARAKAQQVRKRGVSLGDRTLASPDLVGKLGSAAAPLANWGNENRVHRLFMQGALGIHKDKKLPRFAWKTFASRYRSEAGDPVAEPAAKVAYFATCFVNYNEPGIGMDTLEVMARNRVDVALAYRECCGMPSWHNGDMDKARAQAERNVEFLAPFVAEGRTIVATNPTCSLTLRDEYPRMLDTQAARDVAEHTTDPMAFLASLHAEGKLNRDFKTGPGAIAYHMPCHLRAQRLGNKTGALLSLLPDTEVTVVQACSGHDGTWAMKRENFEASLRWGRQAFAGIEAADARVSCSDCPLAAIQIEQAIGKRPLNPLQILAKSYRGEDDWGA